MRPTIRVLVVATGTVLFIGVGRSPDHAANTRGETARAATVVRIQQQPSGTGQGDSEQGERDSADQPASGAAADRAKQAAEAAVSGATAREVERETGDDDNPSSVWEVELTRPDGATVEVDLDAGFNVLATGRDRGGDD